MCIAVQLVQLGCLASCDLWPPYVIGLAIYIFILWFLLLRFFFFVTQSQRSEIGCLPYFHTWRGLSVNLECRSETCCAWLAENTARKKSPISRNLGTIPQLCRAISSQLRHVSTVGKNLLSSNISSTSSALLAAEICWRVWGTSANFNGFRVLAALLHGIPVLGIIQTLRR